MASITISIRDINTRIKDIQDILKSLGKGKNIPCQFHLPKVEGGKIIGAHSRGQDKKSDFRQGRFRIFATPVYCQYYELWKSQDDGRFWYLYRAYLNFFRMERSKRLLEEFISIHCDPEDDSEEPTCTYKRGPHLHVKKAIDPIPRCHFPLNLNHLEKVLSSRHSLTNAIKQAIQVICDEVIKMCA